MAAEKPVLNDPAMDSTSGEELSDADRALAEMGYKPVSEKQCVLATRTVHAVHFWWLTDAS